MHLNKKCTYPNPTVAKLTKNLFSFFFANEDWLSTICLVTKVKNSFIFLGGGCLNTINLLKYIYKYPKYISSSSDTGLYVCVFALLFCSPNFFYIFVCKESSYYLWLTIVCVDTWYYFYCILFPMSGVVTVIVWMPWFFLTLCAIDILCLVNSNFCMEIILF